MAVAQPEASVITRRPSMSGGPVRKPLHPLFQDEVIDIDDGRALQGEDIDDDDDDLNPREDDERVRSDEDDLEGEEATGSHR
jgi:hypothetical protein